MNSLFSWQNDEDDRFAKKAKSSGTASQIASRSNLVVEILRGSTQTILDDETKVEMQRDFDQI